VPTAPGADSPAAAAHSVPAPPSPELLQDVATTFGMLSATVRLHILWLLAHGERDVGTLADQVDQTVATVSHHLAKLKLAGLVRSRREGKRQVYLLDDPHVAELVRLAITHREHNTQPRRAHSA
jgi:DNA-binding transcriptional ArsR family regulator